MKAQSQLKIFFLFLTILTCYSAQSQNVAASRYEVRKVLLTEARYVTDVAKDLEKNAVPVTMVVLVSNAGRESDRISSPGPALNDEMKMALAKARTGTLIFGDIKYRLQGDSTLQMRTHPFTIKVLP